MKDKKVNWIRVIALFFLAISTFFLGENLLVISDSICIGHLSLTIKEFKTVTIMLFYLFILLSYAMFCLYRIRQIQKERQTTMAYNFCVEEEYKIYRSVGKINKKESWIYKYVKTIFIRLLKSEREKNLKNYTEWKDYIIGKYGEKDLLNFSKFLNRGRRNEKLFFDVYKSIGIPILVGMVAINCKEFEGIWEMLAGVSCFIVIIVFSAPVLTTTYNRKNMYEDIIEIVNELKERIKFKPREIFIRDFNDVSFVSDDVKILL